MLRRWPLLALALLVVIPVAASTMDAMRLGLGLLVLFYSNGEIAGRLVISTATAKAHVARLLAKLGARDRVQLVIAAYQAGLVLPSDGPPHEPRPDSRGNKLGAAVPPGAPSSS